MSIGYGYDGSNRLNRVTQAGQPDWSAYYSPSGQRVLTLGNGQSQYFFYNGDNLYSEARSSAAGTRPDARYIHAGLDAPIAGFWDTGVLYYHAGAQGSIGLTTGETGQAVNRSGYTAFGEVQGLSGGAPYRYGYTGRETDITGLMYYRNRYYVPRIGRFTQPDPAGFIDGPNRYLYVGNNPVTFIDPYGLSPSWISWSLFSNGFFFGEPSCSGPQSGCGGGGPVDSGSGVHINPTMLRALGGSQPDADNLLSKTPPPSSLGGSAHTTNSAKGSAKAGVPDNSFIPEPTITQKYVRPSGAGPTAAQKAEVQGKPCVDCGAITSKQVADHKDPLVVQYYREGQVNVHQQSQVGAVQPHCPACSSSQGGQLGAFAKRMLELLGL